MAERRRQPASSTYYDAPPGRSLLDTEDVPIPSQELWSELDLAVRHAWDSKLRCATEDELRQSSEAVGLRFLPFPFVIAFDVDSFMSIHGMFGWDAYFVNCALMRHDRLDLALNHIRNYLFMIERYGFMPNMNNRFGTNRSQTPVFPDAIWRYYLSTRDDDLLYQAFPLLKREYHFYWNGEHHQTPIGLATNSSIDDDPYFPAELAAEAETGLDWTPIFNGDVRRCVPLITNCALVRYARVLSLMARELGRSADAALFDDDAQRRTELIQKYCWDDDLGIFREYDFVVGEQLPYISSCTYWPLWAGVATPQQARRLVGNLGLLEMPHGLAFTDRDYPDPHPPLAAELVWGIPTETLGGFGKLQWMHPAGWACMQLAAIEGFDAYGYSAEAKRISARFVGVMLSQYEKTGKIWEKYNVLDGSLILPNSRYGNSPYFSWTAAAVVILGRRLFMNESQVLESTTPSRRDL